MYRRYTCTESDDQSGTLADGRGETASESHITGDVGRPLRAYTITAGSAPYHGVLSGRSQLLTSNKKDRTLTFITCTEIRERGCKVSSVPIRHGT